MGGRFKRYGRVRSLERAWHGKREKTISFFFINRGVGVRVGVATFF